MCVLTYLHVGNNHRLSKRQKIYTFCRGKNVGTVSSLSHDLCYFGFRKKRKTDWNWKEQAGMHAFNLLARIWQNALVKSTVTIDVSRLLRIKHFSWADEMEQGAIVSEHEPLVITNEPATSITPIVKYGRVLDKKKTELSTDDVIKILTLQSRGSMRCHREEKKAGWCHQRPCESLRSCRRWLLSAARHSHRQPTPHPYSFLGNKYILCRTYRLQSSIPLARLQQLDQMKEIHLFRRFIILRRAWQWQHVLLAPGIWLLCSWLPDAKRQTIRTWKHHTERGPGPRRPPPCPTLMQLT